MANYKCKMCGAELEFAENEDVLICPYCSSKEYFFVETAGNDSNRNGVLSEKSNNKKISRKNLFKFNVETKRKIFSWFFALIIAFADIAVIVTFIVPKKENKDELGFCKLQKINSEEYAVVGLADDAPNEIVIPSEYNDKAVTEISACAFANCASLISITIPSSITNIGYNAFYSCYSLTIYCEEVVKPLSWQDDWNKDKYPVVWGCNENVLADDGCIYEIVDGVRYAISHGEAMVVRQPHNLDNVDIKSNIEHNDIIYSVTTICKNAFLNCDNLKEIIIPYSIINIEDSAFADCDSIEKVSIPASIGYLPRNIFYGCNKELSIIIY